MADVIELEVEVDENGELRLTKEQLGAEPHKRYKVRAEPVVQDKRHLGPLWESMTPEERLQDFREWAARFQDDKAPALSDWAVSRDSIYD